MIAKLEGDKPISCPEYPIIDLGNIFLNFLIKFKFNSSYFAG